MTSILFLIKCFDKFNLKSIPTEGYLKWGKLILKSHVSLFAIDNFGFVILEVKPQLIFSFSSYKSLVWFFLLFLLKWTRTIFLGHSDGSVTTFFHRVGDDQIYCKFKVDVSTFSPFSLSSTNEVDNILSRLFQLFYLFSFSYKWSRQFSWVQMISLPLSGRIVFREKFLFFNFSKLRDYFSDLKITK